jgi:maltose alpha-D-glucosyltransferase/alpha-amylase
VWSDNNEKYAGTRIIFLDHQPSNWSWDEMAGQYYWHRFFAEQPDLNFDNPKVREEMKNIARFWLDLGIDGFRADAVPYLIEREGTSNENLPETHQYLRELRAMIDAEYPDRILLCEANMWPEDVRPYFGEPEVPGCAEFHMGFHFPIMPRIFLSLRKGDASDMIGIMNRTPSIPNECQWCTFLRNHDELTLEMVSEEDRQWMWDQYAPEDRMRLNLGIRRRLAPLLDNDCRKIELANSLLFTIIGTPILYYGDEIGMGDNIWLEDRNGVRTPMQWNTSENAGFSESSPESLYSPVIESDPYSPKNVNVRNQQKDEYSLYNSIKKMISSHKNYKAFGWGNLDWIEVGTSAVAAYTREFQGEKILVLNNLSNISQRIDLPESFHTKSFDILENKQIKTRIKKLSPYQYKWIKLHAI